ncbi:MAG: hypothetical protein ACLGG7_05690 [Bacteriovoracia bacterium]
MKFLGLALLLLSFSALARETSFLVPKNFEKTDRFVKVEGYHVRGFSEKFYRYLACTGSIEAHTCTQIPKLNNISESRLNSIKRSQQVKGTLLAGTEIVGGGIIWKNLVKFTLPVFYKAVRRSTGWSEDVAVGIVSLVPATTTSAGATVVILDQVNEFVTAIDPVDRFRTTTLVNTKALKDKEIVLVKYDDATLVAKLQQMI